MPLSRDVGKLFLDDAMKKQLSGPRDGVAADSQDPILQSWFNVKSAIILSRDSCPCAMQPSSPAAVRYAGRLICGHRRFDNCDANSRTVLCRQTVAVALSLHIEAELSATLMLDSGSTAVEVTYRTYDFGGQGILSVRSN